MQYIITYELATPESAEHGDATEHGVILETDDLREALAEVFSTRTVEVGGVECVEPDNTGTAPRWVTVCNRPEYRTGAQESRSLHLPDNMTDRSKYRVLALMQHDHTW